MSLIYSEWLAILLFIVVSIGLSGVLFGLSYAFIHQNPDLEKTSAYECGFNPFEDARNKFDVRFYVVAILFIIFDLEVIFLCPWSLVYVGLIVLVLINDAILSFSNNWLSLNDVKVLRLKQSSEWYYITTFC